MSYLDVRVFHPNAPSYVTQSMGSLYRSKEAGKKQAYGQRVREVEGGTFTPLVMSTFGGMGDEFEKFLKKLSKRVSDKTKEPYAEVISHFRTRLRFGLLRACLIAL